MKKGRIAKRGQRQPRKSHRVQKAKGKRVLLVGEQPNDRVLKNGKVRRFDLLGKHKKDDNIPRKTREFMAALTHWNVNPDSRTSQTDGQNSQENLKEINKNITSSASEKNTFAIAERTRRTRDTVEADVPHPKRSSVVSQQTSKSHDPGKRFDGMTSGESLSEYSARLRKESKQMAIDIEKKGNHQSEKRRAYNKKRREKVARRKRRRRGDCSDSDVEDDSAYREDTQSIAHLPAYWQEIVHNHGRPVSAKSKKRALRREKEAAQKHTFGDQVDRPPNLTARPVRRSAPVQSV